MANIREIAKLAGVSRSTASLVINNSPLVKKETREKVLAVIRETKYVPNNNARNLSRKIMNSLGIIVLSDLMRSRSYDFHNGTGLYSLNVIQGITSALADTEYSVNIEYFHGSDSVDKIPKLLRDRKVDGAFIVGGYCENPFIERLRDTGIPIVIVAVGAGSSACDSVLSDPAQGAYLSVRHLIEMGHQRIGFINSPATFRSSAQRVKGVERIFAEIGVAFYPHDMMYTAHNNGVSGYEAIRKAWMEGKRYDGIATANPQIAVGAMRFLHEQGVLIPTNVSFVAYEDNSLCGYSNPPLTAINIHKELMGEEAARLLLLRIAEPSRACQLTTIDMCLVSRQSVINRNNGGHI